MGGEHLTLARHAIAAAQSAWLAIQDGEAAEAAADIAFAERLTDLAVSDEAAPLSTLPVHPMVAVMAGWRPM